MVALDAGAVRGSQVALSLAQIARFRENASEALDLGTPADKDKFLLWVKAHRMLITSSYACLFCR